MASKKKPEPSAPAIVERRPMRADGIAVSGGAAPAARSDGWASTLTALGLAGRDKRLGVTFGVDVMSREDQEALWRGDDIAAKIIEKPVDEMMRQGFEIKIAAPERALDEADGEIQTAANAREALQIEANARATRAHDVVIEADPFHPQGSEYTGKRSDGATLPVPSNPPGYKPPPGTQPQAAKGKGAEPPHFNDLDPALNGEPLAGPSPMTIPEAPQPLNTSTSDDNRQIAEAVMAKLEELEATDRIIEALQYMRAYGGAGILVGADDGQTDLTQPLKLESVKRVGWLNVLTPRELYPVSYYNDPQGPKYGQPEIFRIQPETIPASAAYKPLPRSATSYVEVHETRLLIFKGPIVSRTMQRSLNGWGDSVFVRVQQVIADFQQSFSAVGILTSDFAQAVFKIKGLAELIQANDTSAITARATAVDMSRSVARAVIIDAEEDFERKSTPVTGLPDLLQQLWRRVAAAGNMPMSRLNGEQPGGLNPNSAGEERGWYDWLKGEQRRHVKPILTKLVRMIFCAKEGPTKGNEPDNWSIAFNPLWQLSDTEKAEIRLKTAQTDIAYIGAGVYSAEEVAVSRWGGDEYSTDTVIDFSTRDKLAAFQGSPMRPGGPINQTPKGKPPKAIPEAVSDGEGAGAKVNEQPAASLSNPAIVAPTTAGS